MGLLDLGWLRHFAVLHEGVKRGRLEEVELAAYRRDREVISHLLLEAQQIVLEPGQKPRQHLRVARGLAVRLSRGDQVIDALTLNVSVGGLAVLIPPGLRVEDEVDVTLSFPDGAPVRCRARVVDVRQHREGSISVRVGLRFVALEAADCERLELFVFDAILEHLKG